MVTQRTNYALCSTSRYARDRATAAVSLGPTVIKTVGLWTVNIERGVALCLGSIALSCFSALYCTTPGTNMFIAVLLLVFCVEPTTVREPNQNSQQTLNVLVHLCLKHSSML